MKTYAYIFFPLLLLCGCAPTFKIKDARLTEGTDLQQYHTYDFYQVTAQGDTSHVSFSIRSDVMKKAVANEMNKRGFKKATGNADLLINIGVVSKNQIQNKTSTFGQDGTGTYYMGQRNYQWKTSDQEIGRYKDGTATVHLVDAKQNKLVWQGSVQGIVPDRELQLEAAIQQAIIKLFTKFPVDVK